MICGEDSCEELRIIRNMIEWCSLEEYSRMSYGDNRKKDINQRYTEERKKLTFQKKTN